MKILLIGSSAREHALGLMMLKSGLEPRVYVVSEYRNPGLERVAGSSSGRIFITRVTEPGRILEIAEAVSPDLVVIGPEEPLFAGISDTLREHGFAVFGASSKCAEIERSKVFARRLMWRHGINGRLFYASFSNVEDAVSFAEHAGDIVVKPARQVGGKGVKVFSNTKSYLFNEISRVTGEYVRDLFSEMNAYRDIDEKILVELRVEGVEYTLHVISSGGSITPLPVIQDHPHAFEYDVGPETGGMGSISGPGLTPPFLTLGEYEESLRILNNVIDALRSEGCIDYRGVLAGQMMLTWLWGPTVIEFYSRFGDPETGNLLYMLEDDVLEVFEKAASGKSLGKLGIRDNVVVVNKAIAPLGYPTDRRLATGLRVKVDEASIRDTGCTILYGSIEVGSDGYLYTKGSRLAEIVCWGYSYEEAYRKTENAMRYIEGEAPLFHRGDIGSPELMQEKISIAEKIRRVYTSRARRGLLGAYMAWVPGIGFIENPLVNPYMSKRAHG